MNMAYPAIIALGLTTSLFAADRATKVDSFKVVELKADGGELVRLLGLEVKKAKDLNLTAFVQFYSDDYKRCRTVRGYMTDRSMKDAFAGTYIIKIRADFRNDKPAARGLEEKGFAVQNAPLFVAIDQDGKPTGRSTSGVELLRGDTTVQRIAGMLKQFFTENAWRP